MLLLLAKARGSEHAQPYSELEVPGQGYLLPSLQAKLPFSNLCLLTSSWEVSTMSSQKTSKRKGAPWMQYKSIGTSLEKALAT